MKNKSKVKSKTHSKINQLNDENAIKGENASQDIPIDCID